MISVATRLISALALLILLCGANDGSIYEGDQYGVLAPTKHRTTDGGGSSASRGMPYSSSPCWNEAARVIRKLKNFERSESKVPIDPEQGTACNLFTDAERSAMALALHECRSANRNSGGMSASQIASGRYAGAAASVGDIISSESAPCITASNLDITTYAELEFTLAKCISKMDNFTYHLYIEHMNHIENLCFHVHSLLWREQTEQMIGHLSQSANKVTKLLNNSSQRVDQMLSKQDKTIQQQEFILENNRELQNIIQYGQQRVQVAFDDMKGQVEQEHQKVLSLFTDIFRGVHKLTAFQQFLKGKVLDVQSLVLYAFLIFVTHYVTATVKTQGAKGPLFLIWTLMLALEFVLTRLFSEDEEMSQRVLISAGRYCSVALAVAVWVRCYIRYEDPYCKALHEVQSHMFHLEHKMDSYLMSGRSQLMYRAGAPGGLIEASPIPGWGAPATSSITRRRVKLAS